MTTRKTFRLSREHPRLFLLLLVAVLVLWRINVRLSAYHVAASAHVTSTALFDQDGQKSEDIAEAPQHHAKQPAGDLLLPAALFLTAASLSSFPTLRDQQRSGPVPSSLDLYSPPAFVRPPPALL